MSLVSSIAFSKTNLDNRFLSSYNNHLLVRPRRKTLGRLLLIPRASKSSSNSKITCKYYNISVKSSFSLMSRACRSYSLSLAVICFLLTTATSVAVAVAVAEADAIREPEETLSNIPQTLSAECTTLPKDCKKANKIQRPKSKKAESCTIRCVTTCIRAGEGSPGEGPLNFRRPLVVFKQGFRTRHYCLVECSDICNLLGDTNDEP